MSGLITNYLGAGLASARPVTPSITTGATAIYLATDTGVRSSWNGSAWIDFASGTAALLNVDTDGTLAANSDSLIATQKAVKTAIAAAVTGLWEIKGVQDCSANPNYPSALKGDAYIVSVAGKIGGASGVSVDAGDVFVALADNAGGTQASVGTSWFTIEHNLAGALISANNLSDVANAGTARTNLGATAVGSNLFTLSNPGAVTYIRINADNSISALSASAFRAAIGAGTGTGTGDMIAANNLSDVVSIVGSVDNLFTKGADIASASTTNLASATGNFVDVTGTTTITALGTLAAGVERTVRFTGILTLTYNATSLILPTAANITTAAGDVARFRSLGSGNWVCVAYQRASGQALASSGGGGTTVAYVGQPFFRGNNGTVVGANFFSGRALLMPFTGSITAIAVFCTAAQATAKLLPGVYTSDSSGNIATLLGTGPQVTGVTFGLNIIPLTTPVAVTAGDLVYVGCQLTVINTAFASMASNIDTVAFSSSSALPSTAGAGTYGTNGGGSFFAKMV